MRNLAGVRTSTSRSAASSSSRTRTTTARWTSGRCSPTAWCCRAALKVLDRGVLVGEPPNVVADARHRTATCETDTKELVTDTLRPARGATSSTTRTASTGRSTTGCTRAEHGDLTLRLKDGKFEVQPTLVARPVGRHAGRRGAHLPQHERIGAARRSGADAVLHAQSEPAAHPRQLRAAARRQRRQHRLAGAADSRHQSRAIRTASCRDDGTLDALHRGVRADGVSRRSAAGGALRQRVRRRAGRATW